MEDFKTTGILLDDLSNSYSSDPNTIWLFRGQDTYEPLLPVIARPNQNLNTSSYEETMLNELKRRSGVLLNENLITNWDWLVYAQHFGLATRLLDWTSNPLVALWFAIKNKYKIKKDAYLYILGVDSEDYLTEKELEEGPFKLKRTKVVKPTLNNKRIVAQQGWFTIHFYSMTKKRFSFFENTKVGRGKVFIYKIPSKLKPHRCPKFINFGYPMPGVSPLVSPSIVSIVLCR